MSLDVVLKDPTATYAVEYLYTANITHNLCKMADEAGIYKVLWRPEEIGKIKASELIELLEKGLADLRARPKHFEKFNSPNGWGTYEHLISFVEEYLEACKKHPKALIEAYR